MAKIIFSREGTTPFQQLLGHNKEVLEKWNSLENVFFSSKTFSAELKEEVRRTLAFNNGCQYCMAKGKPSVIITNPRVSAAVRFADMFSKNISIDDQFFNTLNEIFTDSEISELCALIGFITACQKIGAVLDLQSTCLI